MEIQISDIHEDVIIGCFENERHTKQPLIIDIKVQLYPFDWLNNDKLSLTVNYDTLLKYIRNIVRKTEFNLLEGLAQYISENLFEKFTCIKQITLKLTKPLVCDASSANISIKLNTMRKFKVALALGSNYIHMPTQQLVNAIAILGKYIHDISIGGFYETRPFGITSQPNFYNTAIIGYTTFQPEQLLAHIKEIEKLMGKQELANNGPRIIDIDLIFFDNLIYTHNFLTIPHRDMHLRDFVLKPLSDISPNWIHPRIGKSVQEMLSSLSEDNTFVLKQVAYLK